MKTRNFVLTLIAVALLPTQAFADDSTNAIRTSFERDLNREIRVAYVASATTVIDPLDAVNVALRTDPGRVPGENQDQLLASFERDLNHGPDIVKTSGTKGDIVADPLEEVNVALRSQPQDGILASFYRDLNREPTTTPVVAIAWEADPMGAVNVALREVPEKSIAQAAGTEDRRYGG